MSGAPFKCLNKGPFECGILFRSSAFHIEGDNNTIIGGRTNCPRCFGEARSLDGTFNLGPDEIEVVSGPPSTREGVDRLNTIYRKFLDAAEKGRNKADDLLKEVEGAYPGLAKALRPVAKTTSFAILLAILAKVILIMSAAANAGEINWNELVSQILIAHYDKSENLSSDLIKLREASSGDKEALDSAGAPTETRKQKTKPSSLARTQNKEANRARRSHRPPSQKGM